MRDHVTEERISAYVDGELQGDELELVERLLAESTEYQQLVAELQELRASLQGLPTFELPPEFHTRVVDRIDDLRVSPSKGSGKKVPNPRKTRPWESVLIATASLAAVVVFTMMLRPPTPNMIGPSNIRETREIPVYLREEPKYVLVYDITVTGRENKLVDKLLEQLGIGIDPVLRLDGQLEEDLVAMRLSEGIGAQEHPVPYKNPNAPKTGEKVELIYVASTLGVIDRFYQELTRMHEAGAPVSRVQFEMVIEPNKLGVMHRLHGSAREHFAHSPSVVPSDVGLAFRLEFRLVSGTAMFPVPIIQSDPAASRRTDTSNLPSLDVNRDGAVTSGDALEVISELNQNDGDGNGRFRNHLDEAENLVDEAGNPVRGAADPGHILLIIRNVDGNAGNLK